MNKQSPELLRFVSNITVNQDNEIVENLLVENPLDQTPNFISRFYTPKFTVSTLASRVVTDLKSGVIETLAKASSGDTIVAKINATNMKATRPRLFTLCKAVILESFSLVYAIYDKPELLTYLDAADIAETRTNVKYLLDAFGTSIEYTNIVSDLQKLDITLGYIQAQVPVIKEAYRNGTL